MRIALLSNLFPPEIRGGYELLAADLARHLGRRGHQVAVLTSGAGQIEADVSRTLRMSRPFDQAARRDRWRHLMIAGHNRRATAQFIQRHGPDVVLVMSLRRLGLEPLRVFGSHNIPSVLTINDDWPAAYVPLLNQFGLGAWLDRVPLSVHTWRDGDVGRVLYVSVAIRDQLRRLGAKLPPGRQCFHGIDRELFPARPFRAMRRPLSMLLPGRIHPSKAPELAIDALAELRQHSIDATLELVGASVTTNYRDQLHARAERAGVADRVRFAGHVSREVMSARYQEADLVLFFSAGEIEGQGMTYLEALASGVPVVACPDAGARELLDRGPAAARPSGRNGAAIAATIAAIAADVDQQRRLYEAGLSFVRDHASLTLYVDALVEELEAARRDRS